MTLDGFLGFLALFIAFYAIVSPVTRLRFQLHAGLQVALAAAAFALVIYLEFFALLRQPCLLPAVACRWLVFPSNGSFTPQQAAFLVVLIWMALAFTINSVIMPGPGSLRTLGKIVQTLIYDGRFSELVDFIRPNMGLLGAVATRSLRRQRLHDWLAYVDVLRRQRFRTFRPEDDGTVAKPGWRQRTYSLFRRSIRWTAMFVPRTAGPQADAEVIARVMLRSEPFRRFLVNTRPDILPDFMALPLQLRFDFADKCLRDLISDSGSVLYQEIENNQNMSGHGYALPEENRLLSYLFGNIENANELQAWKPIGDEVIQAIRSKPQYAEYLNRPFEDTDAERWRDIGFVGIRFFDIMVHEAIRQGLKYHMWLFYLPIFVTEIEKIHDEGGQGVNPMTEFPTRGSRLIYEAISVMGDWVGSVSRLEPNAPHAATPESGTFSSTGIIPVDAATALGSTMATIMQSERIGGHFKRYMNECVLRDIAGLASSGVQGRTRAALVEAVLNGGTGPVGPTYLRNLQRYFEQEDHVLRGQLPDYQSRLQGRVATGET